MDYMGMLGKLLSGKDTNHIMGKDKLRTGRNQYSIPEGFHNEYTGLGLDNMQVRGGSGAEQIPTGFDNEYVEPTEFDPSKLKFGEDVIDTFNPDIPERQQTVIEEPMNPMPMERGEGVTISPLFGKQSLQELERQKVSTGFTGILIIKGKIMPSGKGTYGNQVGRPPKDIYSGAMEGAIGGGAAGVMTGSDLNRYQKAVRKATGLVPGAIGGGAAGVMTGSDLNRYQKAVRKATGLVPGAIGGGAAGVMTGSDLNRYQKAVRKATGLVPGAIGGGAAGVMTDYDMQSLQNSGAITEQQAQLMREQQDYRRQVDQEMLQREALARALRNRSGQGVMTDQDMRNLGNPTTRQFQDQEIDAALLRQQQLDRFQR